MSCVSASTATIWKSMTYNKICHVLGEPPKNNKLIIDAKLVPSLDYKWPKCAVNAVKEFVLAFEVGKGYVMFRGRKVHLDVETFRKAFRLPDGPFDAWRRQWGVEFFYKMFKKDRTDSNPSSIEQLQPWLEDWELPLKVVQQVLLGKSRPTCIHGKQMYVFWSYWWKLVKKDHRKDGPQPKLGADWAVLVLEDLEHEIIVLQNHLRKDPLPKKKHPCSCGTAITALLLHSGFTEAELNVSGQENASGSGSRKRRRLQKHRDDLEKAGADVEAAQGTANVDDGEKDALLGIEKLIKAVRNHEEEKRQLLLQVDVARQEVEEYKSKMQEVKKTHREEMDYSDWQMENVERLLQLEKEKYARHIQECEGVLRSERENHLKEVTGFATFLVDQRKKDNQGFEREFEFLLQCVYLNEAGEHGIVVDKFFIMVMASDMVILCWVMMGCAAVCLMNFIEVTCIVNVIWCRNRCIEQESNIICWFMLP